MPRCERANAPQPAAAAAPLHQSADAYMSALLIYFIQQKHDLNFLSLC